MIATNGLLLLAQQEANLSPANTSGANYYINVAAQVRTHTLLIIPSSLDYDTSRFADP